MNLLTAVNRILPYLSEGSTTSVNDGHPVTASVVAALDTERLNLLQEGYWFNQRTQTLALSLAGEVQVPSTCLSGYCPELRDIIEVRDGKLLNLTTNTTVFPQPVLYQYTEDLGYSQLPLAAQEVVLWKAALTVYVPDFEVDRTAGAMQQYLQRAEGLLTREHLRHIRMDTRSKRAATQILSALRG